MFKELGDLIDSMHYGVSNYDELDINRIVTNVIKDLFVENGVDTEIINTPIYVYENRVHSAVARKFSDETDLKEYIKKAKESEYKIFLYGATPYKIISRDALTPSVVLAVRFIEIDKNINME